MSNTAYETNLQAIAAIASEKEEENDHFLRSLRHYDGAVLDEMANRVFQDVNAVVDCTACGNCCKTLIVNITPPEIERLSVFMNMTEEALREKYIEESLAGNCFINSVPCHFLSGTSCSIYPERFTECRDFPHLHKPGFRERFLGTLLHYGSCPIIYNTVEVMKKELKFIE
ncbi:MAG: YkgJ family cysteine cluster protein [Flavipsychrobacter sp.]|nr:YkgJ family cysteine cluster protein [Flavipsychrobacter sp.]